LFKAASALDIDDKILKSNKKQLNDAFTARNNIIHELDVNFDGGVGKRQRKSRTKVQLKKHSDLLISVASNFVAEVEKKLTKRA